MDSIGLNGSKSLKLKARTLIYVLELCGLLVDTIDFYIAET